MKMTDAQLALELQQKSDALHREFLEWFERGRPELCRQFPDKERFELENMAWAVFKRERGRGEIL